jgi:hypothetical protein
MAPEREAARARAVEAALAKARRGELLSSAEMAAIFRVDRSHFHRRELAGAYDAFKVKPALGTKRFAGALVARYLDGEPLFEDLRGRARLRAAK